LERKGPDDSREIAKERGDGDMTEDKIKRLVDDLCQLYELTPYEFITRDLERSLIEVVRWLTQLYVFGVKSERRMDG
jgi:hypothetical protein